MSSFMNIIFTFMNIILTSQYDNSGGVNKINQTRVKCLRTDRWTSLRFYHFDYGTLKLKIVFENAKIVDAKMTSYSAMYDRQMDTITILPF